MICLLGLLKVNLVLKWLVWIFCVTERAGILHKWRSDYLATTFLLVCYHSGSKHLVDYCGCEQNPPLTISVTVKSLNLFNMISFCHIFPATKDGARSASVRMVGEPPWRGSPQSLLVQHHQRWRVSTRLWRQTENGGNRSLRL